MCWKAIVESTIALQHVAVFRKCWPIYSISNKFTTHPGRVLFGDQSRVVSKCSEHNSSTGKELFGFELYREDTIFFKKKNRERDVLQSYFEKRSQQRRFYFEIYCSIIRSGERKPIVLSIQVRDEGAYVCRSQTRLDVDRTETECKCLDWDRRCENRVRKNVHAGHVGVSNINKHYSMCWYASTVVSGLYRRVESCAHKRLSDVTVKRFWSTGSPQHDGTIPVLLCWCDHVDQHLFTTVQGRSLDESWTGHAAWHAGLLEAGGSVPKFSRQLVWKAGSPCRLGLIREVSVLMPF